MVSSIMICNKLCAERVGNIQHARFLRPAASQGALVQVDLSPRWEDEWLFMHAGRLWSRTRMFTRPSQIKVKRVIIINATNVTPLQILPASPLPARLPNTQNKLIKCSVRHGDRSAFIRPPFTSLTWGTWIMTHVFRAAIAPRACWTFPLRSPFPPCPSHANRQREAASRLRECAALVRPLDC